MLEKFKSLLSWNKEQKLQVKENKQQLPKEQKKPSKKGEKKKLLDLSLRNAKQGRLEQLKQIKISDPQQHSMRLLNQIKKDLRLQVLPEHIECFDNKKFDGSQGLQAGPGFQAQGSHIKLLRFFKGSYT